MAKLARDFEMMLGIVGEMAQLVEPHIFTQELPMDSRNKVYKLDVKVNKLERKIRKRVVAHVTLGRGHIPYCLLMMTLVKDVERIGDYIKNVSEVSKLGGGRIPEGPLHDELAELVSIGMKLLADTGTILAEQDREQALEWIQEGRAAGKRCDQLLVELAKSDFNASQTTAMVLLTRFWKRVGGHLVNILSSVVMPLHKVDYYDEAIIAEVGREPTGGAE